MIVENRISIVRLLSVIWLRLLVIAVVAIGTVAPLVYFELSRYAIDRSIPLIVGTAIAIFLGFRTNSAYERWWEARKLWGGILNDSLNLGRLCRDLIGATDQSSLDETNDQINPKSIAVLREICYRQAAWAYVFDRELKDLPQDQSIEHLLEHEECELVKQSTDPALFLLLQQGDTIRRAFNDRQLDTFQVNLIQEKLSCLTGYMGACNRIKHTNFPTHYSYFTKVFVWIFLVLLGLSLPSDQGVESANTEFASYTVILAIILIGWVFFMVDGIGEYMQSPFKNNRNVIPMKAISRKIEIGLGMTMSETDLPKPIEPIEGALW